MALSCWSPVKKCRSTYPCKMTTTEREERDRKKREWTGSSEIKGKFTNWQVRILLPQMACVHVLRNRSGCSNQIFVQKTSLSVQTVQCGKTPKLFWRWVCTFCHQEHTRDKAWELNVQRWRGKRCHHLIEISRWWISQREGVELQDEAQELLIRFGLQDDRVTVEVRM